MNDFQDVKCGDCSYWITLRLRLVRGCTNPQSGFYLKATSAGDSCPWGTTKEIH